MTWHVVFQVNIQSVFHNSKKICLSVPIKERDHLLCFLHYSKIYIFLSFMWMCFYQRLIWLQTQTESFSLVVGFSDSKLIFVDFWLLLFWKNPAWLRPECLWNPAFEQFNMRSESCHVTLVKLTLGVPVGQFLGTVSLPLLPAPLTISWF